ncbi:putative phage tail protein [Pseudomonas sp. URIL14HWK12:I3]|uniref:phage tail protein n=2 Tax=unclassified Pseudomonas TaxID=196821 RepID=UPI000DADA448|nr:MULTISPECIES: phage tail protein [unclassified Pseudomonas]PZW52748.1 putative phage tail protein [Pseudomonas sp. URIL14HWK12:I2]PZW53493.1 putative phage tail protein [Pseudomonas sp. URIL14HWK12:I3]
MGPVDHLEIFGAKGGESQPKQAVESPDSLRSTNIAKILLAVGEGEFDGVPTDRDIYLDNTPIADASGNVNFPGVKWEWRPGSVEQSYIQGIPSVENETSVNVELRSDNPFTRALSNTQLSAVRVRMSWPRLAKQESNGDTRGYRIEYAIDIATDGGAYVEAHLGAVDGKSTNGYQRSVRVNLSKATSGWMLRVRRLTPNANSGTVADTMTVAGYTEIIDQKIRYPNTALLYIEFDAQQFQNIPAVTVKCKAKRWPVPSTYDPITRTYSGVWDGTFKLAWTNNPAFVTYGLCVEDRFGLGKRIKPWMVDKWEMYRIAQYCDQRVPNGVGGQEPRFLCDMNLQGRAEAWTLLRDLSAIYRGMVYWAHGSLFMQADMPRAQDIDYVFTRSNVIDGEFVYGGAERSTHYSRALVSYDNPANNYDTDVIPVSDNALQRRYRDRPIELSAIGCTRASEAQRRGKWALLSNSQDRTVTFKTGMEGRIPLPGFVIPVADELVAGRPNGGRISSAAGRVVTLDRDTPIKAGDRLIVNLPNGTALARTVHSVAGRAVTVTTEYSLQPEPELQWAIDYDDLAVQLFRVLKTTRTQEGNYEITALEFNPSKFAAIDTGAKLDERPISVIPVTTVAPPASVSLSSGHMIDQGIAVSTMTIAWPAVAGAVAYDVEWRKDNGNWIRLQRTGAASVDVVGIYAGAYLARVRSVSAFDITSIWKSSDLTQLNGKEGLPPAVTFLATESLLFGIGIKWGLPAGAEDTERTELWYSEGTDLGAATKLADLAYPQSEHVMQGLRAGQRFFFWARLVDRSGNVGPFYPVAPTVVTGIASADAGPILEQIKDQITESELGKELTSKIEKIALIDGNGPGSVNERIGTAKTELAKQISDVNNALGTVKGNLEQQITAVSADVSAAKTELQQQIANVSALAGSLPYRKDKAYSVGQSALGSDGKLYQALKAVPLNTPPPNATYWTDVGQAVVTANGMAARVSKVETDVSTLDGKVTAQASQISGLQSSLTTTNGNVSAAQQAAQDAATLAGGKGKVIVQSAAPAVADRLAQNLWIDTTSNANTPKRWSGSAWVAVTDKVATDAAAAAAGALALAQTKADASVVSSLTTRVSDAEGKLSSQATRMDGMQTSIDGKASSQALQQVTSRVTATEDKDKAQDQLISSQSQALTSLTDSVSKKADASAVQSLGNRVEVAEGALSSQSTDITQLKNSVGAAQPFVAGRAWEFTGSTKGWVATATNGTITAGPLFATVTANPNLQCNFTPVVAGAENPYLRIRLRRRNTSRAGAQMYWANEDGGLAEARRFGWFISTTTTDWQDIELGLSGHAGWNGKKIYAIRLDMMNSGDTSGEIDIAYIAVGRRSASASAEAVSTLSNAVTEAEGKLSSQGQSIVSLQGGLNTANGNVSAAQKAAQDAYSLADAKGKVIVQNSTPSAINQQIQNLWIDTTGGGNTPKRWNGSAWQAVSDKVATDAATAAGNALSQVATKADASTVQSLTNKVEQQGTAITAAGEAITGINASLGQVGGENLLPNPSFEVEGPTAGLADGWRVGSSLAAPNRLLSLVPSTLDPRGKAQRVDAKGLSGSAYVDVALPNASWISMAPGQVLTVSAYVRGTQDLVSEIYLQYKNSGGATVGTHGPLRTILSDAWNRPVFTGAPAPAGTIGADLLLRVRGPLGGTASDGYYEIDRAQAELSTVVSAWKDNAKNAQSAAQANAVAISSVSGRVSNTEEGLTSVSGRLTQLDNSIGDVGGENLFYNPAFTKLGAATGNNPDGWVPEGTATYTPSMVSSWLNAAENAYRCSTTGVGSTASGNPYTSLVTASERAPAVAPGQTVTSSIYVRKTSDSGDLGMRIFHQWINAAGTVINAPATAVVPMTVDGDRISFTSVAPTGAAKVRVFYRAHAAIGGTVAGTFEVARPQIEYGSRPTGWRDNGQVNSNAIGAVSTAVDGLTSSVSQQGKDITSVSGRTTSLENSVNNGSTGLASKASTAALTSVANRVAATESGLTAQSSSITNLEAKIGNALPFVAGQTWEFTNSVEGWKANTSGATLTAGPQYATVAKFTTIQVTNTFPVIDGAENPLIRIRLRRRNTGRASAAMYWANEDGGLAEARRFNWPINTSSAEWQDIELDLSGHAGWNGKKIWAIRLDMYNSGDANGEVDIAYIAAGRRSVAASGRAFDSLSVNVSQQGDKLAAETQRINGLQSSVGDANAAIQSEASTRASADTAMGKRVDGVQSSLGSTNAAVQQISTAQANLDGKVNATWSVKLGLTSGGSYYAAGFGLGLENQGGTFQSSFVVLANRFSVLNPVGEGLVNIFTAENGQVVMNDALISKLTVQRAIVGSSINSSELANDGTPIMRMDFASGTLILLNKAATAYTVYNRRGIDMVINGVRRIRMGEWD